MTIFPYQLKLDTKNIPLKSNCQQSGSHEGNLKSAKYFFPRTFKCFYNKNYLFAITYFFLIIVRYNALVTDCFGGRLLHSAFVKQLINSIKMKGVLFRKIAHTRRFSLIIPISFKVVLKYTGCVIDFFIEQLFIQNQKVSIFHI